MLDLSSPDEVDVRGRQSHSDARSGRAGRTSGRGALAAALSLAAVLVGCGSVGEDPGTGGAGNVVTGAGGGSATTTTNPPSSAAGTPGVHGLGPPYPTVLAHGFFGFETLAGVPSVTYFYNVKQTLLDEGEMVDTPQVDPFNNSAVRGDQLFKRIQEILADTGYEKVNIIAHSQGGLDARVVTHDHPEVVASVVTVSTPHLGSRVADIALQVVADPRLQSVVDALVRIIGAPLYDEVGKETSVVEALRQFSTPGIAAFNAKYTDSPGVFYASFGGRSGRVAGGADCVTHEEVPFLTEFDRDLDPTNPLLSLTETILEGDLGNHIPNDGLVRSRDARWGHFWGCMPADHFDEVGQLLGQGPGQGNNWKYMDFYRSILKRLRQEGF